MSDTKLLFPDKNVTFETVVLDGFSQISEGQGFDYIVGKVRGGTVKILFELDEEVQEVVQIDGVDGFGYILICEEPS